MIFTNTTYLSDVPINVFTSPPEVFLDGKTGTLIRITDLTESPWTRGLVRSLYRAVTSICSPFQRPEEFLPEVILEGSNKLDWLKGLLVVTDAIESAPFCFKAKIQNGILDYKYEFKPSHKLTRVEPRISSNKMPIMALSDSGENEGVALDPTTIGTVEIEFYIFDRSSQSLKLPASHPKGLKDFLDQNGGVRVYRDGIRVFDYGEPGNDWLNLGGRRVNVPANRIPVAGICCRPATGPFPRFLDHLRHQPQVIRPSFGAGHGKLLRHHCSSMA